MALKQELQTATFAAGCFWHVQEVFDQVKGVKETIVGYTGGIVENPRYEDVHTGKTGHAESIEIKFEPKVVSYEDLLKKFWEIHDSTTLNRQGLDMGSQYRSVIFYQDAKQKELAEQSKNEEQKKYKKPIVTEIIPAGQFWQAEEYHQKYNQKNNVHNVC